MQADDVPQPSGLALRDGTSRLLRVRVWGQHTRHRPVFCPAPGRAGLLVRCLPVFPCKGRAERLGGSPRPRRHVFLHMGHMLSRACGSVRLWKGTRQWLLVEGSRPQKQETTCVPHATVLSACNSQRRHVLGALTKCLVPPHCWVLGPPTAAAGHRPFTTLRNALPCELGTPHERPAVATGPSHPAPRRR